MTISRRDFLKGTAGAVAVTITGTLLPKEAQAKLLDQPEEAREHREGVLGQYVGMELEMSPARIRWTLYEHPTRKTYSLSGDILVWSPGDEMKVKLDEWMEHGTVDGWRAEGVALGIRGDEVVFATHLNATQEIISKDDELLIQFAQRSILSAFEAHADRRMWGEVGLNALNSRGCVRQWHE